MQLFKTDGVTTVQLTDYYGINSDFNFMPEGLSAAYGSVYFYGQQVSPSNQTYRALWRTDGTPGGTVQVKVLEGVRFQHPTKVVAANGTLFFSDGNNVWSS